MVQFTYNVQKPYFVSIFWFQTPLPNMEGVEKRVVPYEDMTMIYDIESRNQCSVTNR